MAIRVNEGQVWVVYWMSVVVGIALLIFIHTFCVRNETCPYGSTV